MGIAYDDLAEIYDAWIESGGAELDQIRDFYAARYASTDGPVVELGVGNGRILIEAARLGKAVTGIDSSRNMLALCRRKMEEAGVGDRVALIKADFREFRLEEPAELIAIPYDTVGHLLESEDKLACFRHVEEALAPGGCLLLDYAEFDLASARRTEGVPHLRSRYPYESGGREVELWYATRLDEVRRRRHAVIWLQDAETGEQRTVGSVENSWIPDRREMANLLTSAGLRVEAHWGSFQCGDFGAGSEHNVWLARKPA